MKIRMMSRSDLEQVKDLSLQLGYEVKMDELQTTFQRIINDPNYGLFVAHDGPRVLGYIQVNIETKTLLIGPRADIAALVVDEACRGLGVGKELIKTAESWVRENNLKIVRVRSGIKRERAHKFYEREGYVLMKTGHTFQKELL